MRADQFQDFLLQALHGQPGIRSVQSFADAGITTKPLGVRVTLDSGRHIDAQIVRSSPPGGDDFTAPAAPVEGDPALVIEPSARIAGPGDVEHAVAAAIAAAGSREIAAVHRFSTTPGRPESYPRFGVNVDCHSGARVHVLLPDRP